MDQSGSDREINIMHINKNKWFSQTKFMDFYIII